MIKIWLETGGDTGSGELHASEKYEMARVDWDDFNEPFTTGGAGAWWDFFEITELIIRFGDVMPKQTRQDFMERLREIKDLG